MREAQSSIPTPPEGEHTFLGTKIDNLLSVFSEHHKRENSTGEERLIEVLWFGAHLQIHQKRIGTAQPAYFVSRNDSFTPIIFSTVENTKQPSKEFPSTFNAAVSACYMFCQNARVLLTTAPPEANTPTRQKCGVGDSAAHSIHAAFIAVLIAVTISVEQPLFCST